MGSRELDVNSGTLSTDWVMDLLMKGVFQVERYEAQARYQAVRLILNWLPVKLLLELVSLLSEGV